MSRTKGAKNRPKPESWKGRLTNTLKQLLGQKADAETLQAWIDKDEEIRDAMAAGHATPMLIDLLARKIVQLATNPNEKNQWAVELVFDRVEGKPIQGTPPDDGGRRIEDRLDELTKHNLNQIAKPHLTATPVVHERTAEERAAGPARKLMDLPSDRAGRSEAPR